MENQPSKWSKTKSFWIFLTILFLYWSIWLLQLNYAVTGYTENYREMNVTEIRFFVDHRLVIPSLGQALLMSLGTMLPFYYVVSRTIADRNVLLHLGTGVGATILALFVYLSVDYTLPQWWWSFGVTFFVFIVFYGFYAKRLILPN